MERKHISRNSMARIIKPAGQGLYPLVRMIYGMVQNALDLAPATEPAAGMAG